MSCTAKEVGEYLVPFFFFWLVYSFWKLLSTSVDKKQNKKCWHFAQWFLLPLSVFNHFYLEDYFSHFIVILFGKEKSRYLVLGVLKTAWSGGGATTLKETAWNAQELPWRHDVDRYLQCTCGYPYGHDIGGYKLSWSRERDNTLTK